MVCSPQSLLSLIIRSLGPSLVLLRMCLLNTLVNGLVTLRNLLVLLLNNICKTDAAKIPLVPHVYSSIVDELG